MPNSSVDGNLCLQRLGVTAVIEIATAGGRIADSLHFSRDRSRCDYSEIARSSFIVLWATDLFLWVSSRCVELPRGRLMVEVWEDVIGNSCQV